MEGKNHQIGKITLYKRHYKPYKVSQGRQIGLKHPPTILPEPNLMRTANRLTRQRKAEFLAALSSSANVSLSCQTAGVSRASVYAAKQSDPDFAQAWALAMQTALDALEAELISRAIEGTQNTQYYHGKPIGTVTSYSDTLAMFLLKAHRPDVYGDLKNTLAQASKANTDEEQREGAYRRLLEALEELQRKRAANDRSETH